MARREQGCGNFTAWLDVRARLSDSRRARALARQMRRAGAAHVMQREREVWSLWPAGETAREALAGLARLDPELTLHIRRVQGADPRLAWRLPSPEPVGRGLFLAPAWMGLPAGPDTLVIDALTAFGAGDHPSTRLNLRLICALAETGLPAGGWLADVGSGSGVLALALALKTGRRVVAVDPDPAAARALRRNQALNPLAGPLVRFARATHAALAGPLSLAAANLPGPILRVAAEHLAQRLAPGGWLLASGFRREAEEDLAGFMAGLGLAVRRRARAEGWSGLALQRAAA